MVQPDDTDEPSSAKHKDHAEAQQDGKENEKINENAHVLSDQREMTLVNCD